MQVISGSYSIQLAQKIAQFLHTTVTPADISTFPNGELKIRITEPVLKKTCIIQSFAINPNRAFMEFALLVDAAKRAGAQHITAVIPWMGYCIQDKIFRPGEPLSAKVIADLIQALRIDKVITVDLHNQTLEGFFSIPIQHLSALPLYTSHFKEHTSVDCVVGPDVGALKETTRLAQQISVPMVILNKQRDITTGQIRFHGAEGHIKGKHALMVDDFISTGETLMQAASFLHEQGFQTITVAVTHHLFVPETHPKILKSHINELYITDTIDPPEKLQHLSSTHCTVHIKTVAELIAKVLQ